MARYAMNYLNPVINNFPEATVYSRPIKSTT
jgi:hypothetical protein